MDSINDIRARYADKAGEAMNEAQARWKEGSDHVKRKAQEIWEDSADFIRANPGASVGIALLSGVVIGAALGGRRSRWPSAGDMADDLADKAGVSWEEAKTALSRQLTQLRGLLDDALCKLEK